MVEYMSMTYQALAELPRAYAEEVFVKISIAASRSARLGIFNLECSHRFHQTLSASASLGKGKIHEFVAAESILNAVRQHHNHALQEFLVCTKTYCRTCRICIVLHIMTAVGVNDKRQPMQPKLDSMN